MQKIILPLRDHNSAYLHGFQCIHSNILLKLTFDSSFKRIMKVCQSHLSYYNYESENETTEGELQTRDHEDHNEQIKIQTFTDISNVLTLSNAS